MFYTKSSMLAIMYDNGLKRERKRRWEKSREREIWEKTREKTREKWEKTREKWEKTRERETQTQSETNTHMLYNIIHFSTSNIRLSYRSILNKEQNEVMGENEMMAMDITLLDWDWLLLKLLVYMFAIFWRWITLFQDLEKAQPKRCAKSWLN